MTKRPMPMIGRLLPCIRVTQSHHGTRLSHFHVETRGLEGASIGSRHSRERETLWGCSTRKGVRKQNGGGGRRVDEG